jgi:peptide alpha-N-acetyltransferase
MKYSSNRWFYLVQMMREYYDAAYVSLHVRVTNKPALHMYKDILGFEYDFID